MRRIRRAITEKLRAWLPELRAAATPLRNPQKLLQLIGGNLAAELLFASALTLILVALHSDIGLVDALFVNISASLLAMFIPIPGGIGVTEGAMIVGLTGRRRLLGDRLRRGHPVPDRDLLPAALLGLVRAAVAREEPPRVTGSFARSPVGWTSMTEMDEPAKALAKACTTCTGPTTSCACA